MNDGPYTKEKLRGGGDNTSSPISLSNTFYTKPDIKNKHFLDNIRCIFIVKRTGWRHVETTCRSNVITSYIHGLYIGGSESFFKQAGKCCYLLNGYFLWVSQSLMSLNSRHRNCVIYGYLFCVYWSEALCAHLYIWSCTADSRVQAHVCVIRVCELWCRIFKKCLKLCSMKFWTCLGSILQQKQNSLQGSDTNLEFNT